MKRMKILVGTLLCVLTSPLLHGMAHSLSLGNYIELRSFFLEGAAICLDKKSDPKHFIRLMRHLKGEAVAQALGVDIQTLRTYFNADAIVELLELCAKEGRLESKADALIRSCNLDTFEQACGTVHIKKAIKQAAKLCFFSGTDDEKKELLGKFKETVELLQQEGSEKLTRLIRLEKIHKLIEDALADKPFEWNEFIAALVVGNFTLSPYFHLGNVLHVIKSLLKEEPLTPMTLINAVGWDTFLLGLPHLCGLGERLVEGLFDKDLLEEQLKRFQNNQPLDPHALRNTLRADALQRLHIQPESLDDCIDFTKVARGLTKLRNNLPAPELREACNFERIKEQTGIDIQAFFNRDVPEQVQHYQLDGLVHTLTNREFLRNGKLVVLGATSTALMWILGHEASHEWMEVFEPTHWYTAWPCCLLLIYLLYRTMHSLDTLPTQRVISTNLALIKAGYMLKKQLGTLPTTHQTVLESIPQDTPGYESIKQFLSLITPEQLQILSHPCCILMLFENPSTFITKQEDFIDRICSTDPEHIKNRVTYIVRLLETQNPYNTLPHAQSFTEFKDLLKIMPAAYRELPHKKVMKLAQYRPHLLMRYRKFLEEAAKVKVGNDNLLLLLMKALAQAHTREHHNFTS